MVEAQLGVISELGRFAGVPTPCIDIVYALVKQRATAAGCFPRVSFCQLARLQQHYRYENFKINI